MAAFDIGDVADLMGIERLGNGDSFGVVCPYCGDARGKMDFCIRKGGRLMNTFHCFHCDAGGNMLTLYADLNGLTGKDRCKRAYREISEKLRMRPASSDCRHGAEKRKAGRVQQAAVSSRASAEAVDTAYRELLSMLQLSAEHERKLVERGLSREQIDILQARSIPVQEGERLARMLLFRGILVKGIPGFYKNARKNWSIAFPKSTGILFPIPDENGRYCGIQMRMDEVRNGRKYLWLSSGKYPEGVSSGSPAAFWGNMDSKEIAVTEGGLKAYCAWCFSQKPFIGLPGVGQAKSVEDFLRKNAASGLTLLECMDMDKFMDVTCDRSGNQCERCEERIADIKKICPGKLLKRTSIREGCNRLYGLCEEHGIPYRRVKWCSGADGRWNGSCKGIDDYLLYKRRHAGGSG